MLEIVLAPRMLGSPKSGAPRLLAAEHNMFPRCNE